jgi:hypothetical protein
MLTVMLPYTHSGVLKIGLQNRPRHRERLILPEPKPVPAPVFDEAIVGAWSVSGHAPHVTVAVAGTTKTGVLPLLQRGDAAPVALVAELGSMFIPYW